MGFFFLLDLHSRSGPNQNGKAILIQAGYLALYCSTLYYIDRLGGVFRGGASRGGRTAEGATAGAYPRSRAREGLRAVVLISERRSPVTYAVFIPNQVRTDQEASDPGLSPPARSRQAWHRRGMGAVRSI